MKRIMCHCFHSCSSCGDNYCNEAQHRHLFCNKWVTATKLNINVQMNTNYNFYVIYIVYTRRRSKLKVHITQRSRCTELLIPAIITDRHRWPANNFCYVYSAICNSVHVFWRYLSGSYALYTLLNWHETRKKRTKTVKRLNVKHVGI